jgi:uncharacterized protein (TIGR02231 family)
MRKLTLTATFILCMVQVALAPAQTVPSEIKTVTLFSNQALIQREAAAAVDKGLNEILLETETFSIDPDSVMAKVFGDGEVFSVQYKETPVKEPPQEKIRRLEEKLRQLRLSKKELLDRNQALKKQEAFLDAFIDFSQTQVPKDIATGLPKPEELGRTLSFLSTNYQKLYEQARNLDSQIEDLERNIQVAEKELEALRGSHRQVTRVIEILFQSAKEQRVRIQAQYLSRNAQWQPLYKVAVPADLSQIDLTLFSRITQKTGEDWNAVDLAVSTVIPLRGIGLPTLYSWLLDMPRPAPVGAARDRAAAYQKAEPAMESAAPPAALDEEGRQPEAGFAQARRRESPLSFEYTLPRPISIASRDKETLLPLFTKKLQGDFYYYCVPKRSAMTFLVARVQSDKELLGGMLNIYFGGQYVGKTLLREKIAGEAFSLNLGADREVVVKRRKTRDSAKETYFGKFERDTVMRELAYKITAENLKDRAVTLKILDHVPVSKTDRIEVKDLQFAPEPAEKDLLDREGVMLWELPLKPGEKKEITIAFAVAYPKEIRPNF